MQTGTEKENDKKKVTEGETEKKTDKERHQKVTARNRRTEI